MAKRARYRAVSPKGVACVWRRSIENAVRDAFYADRGIGQEHNGITVRVNCDLAMCFAEELAVAGWTFEQVRK